MEIDLRDVYGSTVPGLAEPLVATIRLPVEEEGEAEVEYKPTLRSRED